MNSSQKQMLMNIMALEFVALEFNLYLDTHPEDHLALADFSAVSAQLQQAKEEYENLYGPFMNYGFGQNQNPSHWQWVDEPWPWEMEF